MKYECADEFEKATPSPKKTSRLAGLIDMSWANANKAADLNARLRVILDSLSVTPDCQKDEEAVGKQVGLDGLEQSLSQVHDTHREIEGNLQALRELVGL